MACASAQAIFFAAAPHKCNHPIQKKLAIFGGSDYYKKMKDSKKGDQP